MFFFPFIFSVQNLTNGAEKNTSDDIRGLLGAMNIIPYPTQDELSDCVFPDSAIEVSQLLTDDVNNDFTNLSDLNWLRHIGKANRVFLFGETHYYQAIHNLRNRIFFALNIYDYYPLVSFECAYSRTPFIEHYLTITDEDEAKRYYKDVICDMVLSVEDSLFLEHIRRWNRLHPQKKLHIGFHDIEHDYATTLKKIVVPYFQLIDSTFDIDTDTFILIHLGKLIDELKERLNLAKAKNLIGAYSFITPQYMECVLENLLSTYQSYYYEGAFDYYRQKAIIRNLTDERFLGKYLRRGKVMLHAGGYHTKNRFYYPEEGNFYSEGSYLNFEYEPTKGKTFSLFCVGYAYSFGEMVHADADSLLYEKYTDYGRLIDRFQKAYRQKLVTPEEYYIMNKTELNDFDKLIFKIAYANNHSLLKIEKINWDLIFTKISQKSKEDYKNLIMKKDNYSRYDQIILVPRSKIIRAKERIKKSE